jgi:hypothetical protein
MTRPTLCFFSSLSSPSTNADLAPIAYQIVNFRKKQFLSYLKLTEINRIKQTEKHGVLLFLFLLFVKKKEYFFFYFFSNPVNSFKTKKSTEVIFPLIF